MDFTAVLLVVLSSGMHAYWNLLLKKSKDMEVFVWCFLIIIILIFSPLFCVSVNNINISPIGWLCIVSTGLVKTFYFISLSNAYRKDDLSFVYPIARSAPIIFVFIGALLFLGETPSVSGIVGMILILLGVYTIHVDSLGGFFSPLRSLNRESAKWALITALFITLYSIIDKIGVGYVDAFTYIFLMFVFMFIFLTPHVFFIKNKTMIKTEWNSNKKDIVTAGILNFCTFYMILIAMSLANLSYIVALREISIIFGVILGAMVLKEEYFSIRLTGSILIVIGSVFVGFA